MPNEYLIKDGTAIVLANTGEYSPGATAANNLGTRTDQIDLGALAAGAARQSDKVDLGAKRAEFWSARAAFEFDVAPTSGDVVSLFWAPSTSSTAGQDNPAGVSGSDSAYTGTTGDTLANSVRQLDMIGTFIVTDDTDAESVQVSTVGVFRPASRYGTLVVYNETGQALMGDAVEMAVRLLPQVNVDAVE